MRTIKAYYGDRISPNMTRTKEGFLICHNVPIARTGSQDYLAQEIGLPERYGEVIKMHRPEEEVFALETLASFEGKPVVDGHPTDDVRPDNWSAYTKGTCTNVRRGTGADADKIVADLIIYDAIMQSEIEAGKRDISCGYEYVKEITESGEFIQRNIRGNHVAIVDNGRAGKAVRIRDEDTTIQKGSRKMKNTKQSLWGKMVKAFARDAEPEEVADAMELMAEASKEPEAPAAPPESEAKDEGENEALTQIMALLQSLDARLSALEKPAATEDEDPLDGLEKELSDSGEQEESVTVPAAELANDECEEPAIAAADRQTILSVVRAIKPAIADLPEAERRKASDSLSAALRSAMQKPAAPEGNQYQVLLEQRQASLAKDAAPDPQVTQEAYNKRNPHYQPKEAK